MESITLREVLQRAACRIGCAEDSVWGELDSAAAGLTKVLLETLAESEVERRVGARLYERGVGRTDHRNGYRKRVAQLSYQVLEIRIPRLRGQGFVPSFLEPGHRAIAQVEGWVDKALMVGLSRADSDTAVGIDYGLPAQREAAEACSAGAGQACEAVQGASSDWSISVSVSGRGLG